MEFENKTFINALRMFLQERKETQAYRSLFYDTSSWLFPPWWRRENTAKERMSSDITRKSLDEYHQVWRVKDVLIHRWAYICGGGGYMRGVLIYYDIYSTRSHLTLSVAHFKNLLERFASSWWNLLKFVVLKHLRWDILHSELILYSQWRRQNDNWGGGRIFIYVRSA